MTEIWYDYRTVWASHVWVLVVGVVGAVTVLIGLIGTIVANRLALLFIPGLAVLFAHHLIVRKRIG